MRALSRLIPPGLIPLFLPGLLGQRAIVTEAQKPSKRKVKLNQIRIARAHRLQASRLAKKLSRMSPIFPPKRGRRRPEWSSAIAGRWSSLNGSEA